MGIFWSELRGNAVTKAKGSLLLSKLKVDALTVKRRGIAVFQCCRSSEVLNLNNSLNIKIKKKKCVCVCSNANPLHYYALRVPHKADRWRLVWSIFESRTAWTDHVTCGKSICIV